MKQGQLSFVGPRRTGYATAVSATCSTAEPILGTFSSKPATPACRRRASTITRPRTPCAPDSTRRPIALWTYSVLALPPHPKQTSPAGGWRTALW